VSTEETRHVVASYVAALQRGDIDAVRAGFTPKATWTIRGDIPVAGTWTGPGEILDGFLAQLTATLDPATPVTQDLHRLRRRRVDQPRSRPQRNTLRQRLRRRLPRHRRAHRRRHRVLRYLLHEARPLRPVTANYPCKIWQAMANTAQLAAVIGVAGVFWRNDTVTADIHQSETGPSEAVAELAGLG
jgi:ketosteroid isomerase-like protein